MKVAKGRTTHAIRCLTAALITILAAGTATACSQEVSGYPEPGMSPVDLTTLDYGTFPTEPTPFEVEVSSDWDIYALESRRMLDFLISPYTVDPDLRYLRETSILREGTDTLNDLTPEEFVPIANKNFFVSGVATGRSNNSLRNLKDTVIGLMRFGNDHYARTAAAEFNAFTESKSPTRQKVEPAGYEDAYAGISPDQQRAQLYAAHGPYVIVAGIQAPATEIDQTRERLKKILDLQSAALNDVTPTPPDEMLDLPTNPEGIVNLALPNEYQNSTAFDDSGAFSAAAHLHWEYDAAAIPDYNAYGVDLVARNNAVVYRTAGVPQAFALQNVLARPGKYDKEIEGPPGLADARCVQRDETSLMFEPYYCVVVYDRYVALVDDTGYGDLPSPELFQSTSAQYAILANSR
ncbi:DUF7373 family lipoprotein [Nocardia carnea]|uniref:DUF7373 family lipoprotein n=1 Tax=Nocardia carnea TaxID=37328 RepID=UPI002456239E|nr:hypothetical protein [Nocardia carnea]